MNPRSKQETSGHISDDDAELVKTHADGWESAWARMQLALHEAARMRLCDDPRFAGRHEPDASLEVADELVFIGFGVKARRGTLLAGWDASQGSVEAYLIGGQFFIPQANSVYWSSVTQVSSIAGLPVKYLDQWEERGDGLGGIHADSAFQDQEEVSGANEETSLTRLPEVSLKNLETLGPKQKFVFVAQLWETIASQQPSANWTEEHHAAFRRDALASADSGEEVDLEREIAEVVRHAVGNLQRQLEQKRDAPKIRSAITGTLRLSPVELPKHSEEDSDPEFVEKQEGTEQRISSLRYRDEVSHRLGELRDEEAYIHMLIWLHPLGGEELAKLARCSNANANQMNKRYRNKWPVMLATTGERALAIYKRRKA